MSKVWLAKIEGGKPIFSEYVGPDFREWAKVNEGHQIRIEQVKKPVSENLRGYYFGGVIPVIRSTCEKWEKLSAHQVHERVKKMLFYEEDWNPMTQRIERFGKSVMSDDEWNNTTKAMEFLEVITDYLAGCGLQMPDNESFKNLRDIEIAKRQDYQKPTYNYPESTGEPLI